VLVLVATVGLGAMFEWQQTRVPGRFGSVADALLNTLGAVAGLIAAILLLQDGSSRLPPVV
jgi:VanZ family protein